MLVDFTGGLSSLSHAATHSMSSLHLNSVQLTDNGNYTCQPSGLQKVGPVHLYICKPVNLYTCTTLVSLQNYKK